MINEAHGTSLYGLDDSIKKLYNDIIDEIDIKNYKNEYTIEYNKFIHNDTFISFKVKKYKIIFNINDYFDIENNYTITIYIRDIIDDSFLSNVKNYKDLLDDYYGETDIDNNNILLILNSYNLKINPKPFLRTIEKITDNYRLCESVYLGKLNLISKTSKSFINECKRKLNSSINSNA